MAGNNEWTAEELEIAVKTYFKMLELEKSNKKYKKADFRNEVLKESIFNRTAASFEYRMRNISAVLDDLGLLYIKGYLPAQKSNRIPKRKYKR